MLNTGSGPLPHHIYCYVDSSFIRKEATGFEECVWFGLSSTHGRMWGCHVMLKCGAVYRNVPPHAIAFKADPELDWKQEYAQVWDCYGSQFSTVIYPFLNDLNCDVCLRNDVLLGGDYLFTAIPLNDGYTAEPRQSKEFKFIRLDNGRLTIQPTDRVLFVDDSFTKTEWPVDLKPQTDYYSCEG
jgi:hypothetical protein